MRQGLNVEENIHPRTPCMLSKSYVSLTEIREQGNEIYHKLFRLAKEHGISGTLLPVLFVTHEGEDTSVADLRPGFALSSIPEGIAAPEGVNFEYLPEGRSLYFERSCPYAELRDIIHEVIEDRLEKGGLGKLGWVIQYYDKDEHHDLVGRVYVNFY